MLYLITGAPGAGKSNYMVSRLVEFVKENRPIYQHGIDELKLPHQYVFCRDSACKVCEKIGKKVLEKDRWYADDWQNWANENAVIVLDEVQRVWRPGGKDRKLTDDLRSLETSRHSGIDIWMVTQHPSFLDVHVRRLNPRHYHVVDDWNGRHIYETTEVNLDPSKKSGTREAVPLDKSVYGMYKSAEIHTKKKKKIPRKLKYVVVTMVLSLGALFYLGNLIFNRTTEGASNVISESQQSMERLSENVRDGRFTGSSGFSSGSGEVGFVGRDAIAESPLLDRAPVVAGRPETAPAWFHLVEVVTYPRLAACVHQPAKGSCNCYSQQGTPVSSTFQQCLNFTQNEREFNPYRVRDGQLQGRGGGSSFSSD